MPPEPDPIVTYHQTFALEADPEALQAAAAAIRGLALRAHAADQIVDGAADEIESEEAWRGETAGNYQDHRRRLTGDLASLGYGSGRAADTLDEIADLLIWYQAALDSEKAALAGIPSTRSEGGGHGPHEPAGPVVTYHPRSEDEATAVSDAMLRASELKSELNEHLAEKETALRREVDGYARPPAAGDAPGLAMLARTWRPRTISVLNFNIGQGDENSPGNSGGTDHGDIDDIAQIIADEDVDVVTVQEMFGQEREHLEQELRERTGDDWTVHFGEASNKIYWSDGYWHRGVSTPFGNAIAVRHGRLVEDSEHVETHDLNRTDPLDDAIITETEDGYVRVEWTKDGEGRSATEVELTIDDR